MISKSNYVTYLRCHYLYFFEQQFGANHTETAFTSFGDLVGKLAQDSTYEDIHELIGEMEDSEVAEIKDKAKLEVRALQAWREVDGSYWVDGHFEWERAAADTKTWLNDLSIKVIFEATFIHDWCGCRVDILIRGDDGIWIAKEVKSFLAKNALGKLREGTDRPIADSGTWLDDIAFQYWVVSFTLKSVKFELMCSNDKYQLDNGEKYFTTKVGDEFDLEGAIGVKLAAIPDYVAAMKSGLKVEKSSKTAFCKACPHAEKCRGKDWAGWFWNGNKLQDKKISGLVEEDFKNSKGEFGSNGAVQCRILKAILANAVIFDKDNLGEVKWAYPVNDCDRSIDFESLIHPFPRWPGQTPWEPVPFMFSWGKPANDDAPQIYMAPDPKADPRRFVIDKLCELADDCPGRLFHWSAYDRTVMGRLIEYETDSAKKEKLLRLHRKMVDLCEIVRRSYYRPDFGFSFSIKKVGPCFSGRDYAGCKSNAITSGLDWSKGENLDEIGKYCGLDTAQMGPVARTMLGVGPERAYAGKLPTKKWPKLGPIVMVPDAIAAMFKDAGISLHKGGKRLTDTSGKYITYHTQNRNGWEHGYKIYDGKMIGAASEISAAINILKYGPKIDSFDHLPWGTSIPDGLIDNIRKACEDVNSVLLALKGREDDLEMKTKSTAVHDWFVGSMGRLGYYRGPSNSKPDLLHIDKSRHWLEVKASGKKDWQRHPVDGQEEPPQDNIHILLDVNPYIFRIAAAYVLLNASWKPGSSKNGLYQRLDESSQSRKTLVWESTLHSPTPPNSAS